MSDNHHPGLLTVRLKPAFHLPQNVWAERLSGRAAQALGFLERSGRVRSIERLDGDEDGDPFFPSGEGGATAALFSARRGSRRHDDPLANLVMVEVDPSQPLEPLLDELANDPLVLRASRVPIRHLIGGPPTGQTGTSWWNLTKIRWDEARGAKDFVEANDITVAVLDTGVDDGHPDLKECVDAYWCPKGISRKDIVGHGTHVAGTIAARIGNGVGIDGICACRLRPFKVFNDEPTYVEETGRFSYLVNPKSYLRALRRCKLDSVQIVNLSLAGYERDPEEEYVIGELIRANRIVVAGMGNDGRGASRLAFPAAFPDVIAVGATTDGDSCIESSSRGDHIALCAPGDAIWSTLPTYPGVPENRPTGYFFWTGTSMAAAHVSGAVALLLARNSKLSPADVRRRLMETAEKVEEMASANFTPAHGAGRLALAALLA